MGISETAFHCFYSSSLLKYLSGSGPLVALGWISGVAEFRLSSLQEAEQAFEIRGVGALVFCGV